MNQDYRTSCLSNISIKKRLKTSYRTKSKIFKKTL